MTDMNKERCVGQGLARRLLRTAVVFGPVLAALVVWPLAATGAYAGEADLAIPDLRHGSFPRLFGLDPFQVLMYGAFVICGTLGISLYLRAQIKRLPGKFVIDHTGKFLEPVSTDSKEFRSLLNLLDTGRCWVKLSAPYETSKTGAPKYEDVSVLARALVKHAPQRMLWALNWPHPGNRKPAPPDDAALCDLLLDWAPNEKDRQRMLVDNPAELYGF